MSFLTTIDYYEVFSSFQHPSREEIFHYIDLMYNKESELVTTIQDINIRKKAATETAGLDMSQPWVQDIVNNNNAEINALVTCYIGQIQNNHYFQMLITAEEYFSELQQLIGMKLMTGKLSIGDEKVIGNAKTKGELMNLSETTAERIKRYREILYPKELGFDPTTPVAPKKRISPETIAKKDV